MPMPNSPAMSAPRTLTLSWRAADGALGARVKQWVDLLKTTLNVQCRNLRVADVREPGSDRHATVLAMRENKCTDFLAVYTMQYCQQCAEEAGEDGTTGENELVELARRLGESCAVRWVARLHVSPPWDAAVGPFEPWRERTLWHFLPGPGEKDHFSLGVPEADMDTDIYERCVVPLKASLAAAPTRQP